MHFHPMAMPVSDGRWLLRTFFSRCPLAALLEWLTQHDRSDFMSLETALQAWQSLLGDNAVLTGAALHTRWGRDTAGNERQVPAALSINSASQLPDVLAVEREH